MLEKQTRLVALWIYIFVNVKSMNDICIITVKDIEELIVTLRGVQVLIDRDLAFLYQVEVKQMNRQVKRNIERFPEDFMFQLTKEEFASLKCHFGTSNERGGDRRALPYAFTQQGIGMLSGLLRSQVAIDTNIKIMRAFVGMQRYIAASMEIFQRLDRVELQQLENKQWMKETDNKIETLLEKIEENSPKLLPEQVFQTGCVWDAWAYISDLVRIAKNRIILIDNYVDDRVLSLLTKRSNGVTATIHTRYNEQFLTDLKKHNTQYPAINYIQLSHRNHDRFLIIDDKVYLLGASLKDIGASLCAVTEMTISPEKILGLL
ncbi:MAG: ORF6N domain-containing protein [Selenomonadaceae bacterium]|nr:ORF6N domain-containing protein [Selenomonadaceae bacterium]